MDDKPKTRSYDWPLLMLASGLLAIRFVMRLVFGPSGTGPANWLSLAFDAVLAAVLSYALFNLGTLLQGREKYRTLTGAAFAFGVVSALGLILLPH